MPNSRKNPKRRNKKRKTVSGKQLHTKAKAAVKVTEELKQTLAQLPDYEAPTWTLETVWEIGNTVAGKTIKEIIDWHYPYLEFWIPQFKAKLDEETANYLAEAKIKNPRK